VCFPGPAARKVRTLIGKILLERIIAAIINCSHRLVPRKGTDDRFKQSASLPHADQTPAWHFGPVAHCLDL